MVRTTSQNEIGFAITSALLATVGAKVLPKVVGTVKNIVGGGSKSKNSSAGSAVSSVLKNFGVSPKSLVGKLRNAQEQGRQGRAQITKQTMKDKLRQLRAEKLALQQQQQQAQPIQQAQPVQSYQSSGGGGFEQQQQQQPIILPSSEAKELSPTTPLLMIGGLVGLAAIVMLGRRK